MDMENRKKTLKLKLKERLGAEYEVIYSPVPEPEDKTVLMVGIRKAGEAAGIWTYLNDGELEWLDDEAGIQKAVSKVVKEYNDKRKILNGPYLTGESFNEIKDRIVFGLENEKENEKALDHIPYIRFYDMVAYFRILITKEGESYSRTVRNEDLSLWEVDLQEVLAAAKANTPVLYPPVIQRIGMVGGQVEAISIGETLDEMLIGIESCSEQNPIYLLTNRIGQYGAVGLINNHLLSRISDSCNDNLVILPKNIHEVMLIPSSKSVNSIADWTAIVRMYNSENKGQRLSEAVYLFDKGSKKLRPAKEDDFRV